MKQEAEIKNRIIDATMELIKKYGDSTRITVREIAAASNVGVGLINYHFQTKDHLIDLCLIKGIGYAVEHFETVYQKSDLKAIDKLRIISKDICAFMAADPGFSTVSIVNDFASPDKEDNSAKLVRMLMPIAKEICRGRKNEQELYLLLHIFISSVQAAFLRRTILEQETGIDFNDAEDRERFIDICIEEVFSDRAIQE